MSPPSGRPLPSGAGAPSPSGGPEAEGTEDVSPGEGLSAEDAGTTFDAEEGTSSEGSVAGSRPLAHGGPTVAAGTEDDEEDEEAGEEGGEDEKEGDGAASEGKEEGGAPAKRPEPKPGELRKAVVRFVLFFMGFMGIFMLVDPSERNQVAGGLGLLLQPTIGFGGNHIEATMFVAAALEMGASALAYHFTMDWVHTAKTQKDQAAIRPLYMAAMRSQKKDRIKALQPHMEKVNLAQSQVTINQLKGMVITWVLLIAIYTWVGLFIASQCPAVTSLNAPTSAPLVGAVTQVNSTETSGYAPYTYVWWAESASTGATIVGPNVTSGPDWSFVPPDAGQYVVIVLVTDARDNQVEGHSGTFSVVGSSSLPETARPGGVTVPSLSGLSSPPSLKAGCLSTEVYYFGLSTNLLAPIGPVPTWFLGFSLYTIPLNLIFRRYLKHAQLLPHLEPPATPAPPVEGGEAVGAAEAAP